MTVTGKGGGNDVRGRLDLRPVVRLLPVLHAERGLFLRTTAATIAHQLAVVLAAALAAVLVGQVAGRAAEAAGGSAAVGPLVAVLGAVVVGVGTLSWTEMWFAHVLAYRILALVRMRVFDALHRTAPGGLLRRRTGDLAGAAMADVEALEWFYAHTASATVAAVVAPAVLLGLLGAVVGWPALVVAVAIVLTVAAPWSLRHTAAAQGGRVRAGLGVLKAEALDGVQGLRELLVHGRSADHRDRLVRRTQELQRAQRAYALRTGVENAIADALLAGATLAVVALCALQVADGRLDIALYPAAVVLTVGAFVPVAAVYPMFSRLGEIASAAERVFAVVDAPPNVVERASSPGASRPAGPIGVRFVDVTFRYAPELPDALRGVDFAVQPGETVALVGESGAGKSTCAHLLMRFWDPTSGQVLLDGVPTTERDQAEVREIVGLVPQDGYLFHTSIRDNITLARPAHRTGPSLEDAVRGALLEELVAELPDGLDTVVGERGAALSGGQRQRVAIARALLRDPAVLVLDEPVSNLDAAGEAALTDAMARLRSGRTTIVIAHRLSTIRAADRVVFLDGGTVAAVGTHDLLHATVQRYRAVVAQQDDTSRDPGRPVGPARAEERR